MHFRYPLADGVKTADGKDYIVVATTRPETMLGDTGVAVNPEDPRYKDLIGKEIILPIVDRRIPIVGDEHADMEKGTGCVKITPAHDFNDYEVGKRHQLPMINILTSTRTSVTLLKYSTPTAKQATLTALSYQLSITVWSVLPLVKLSLLNSTS